MTTKKMNNFTGELVYKFYIYKVIDKETKEFYIGSQVQGKVIGKNYFTSSSNKNFREKFKSNPSNFDIKIIGVLSDPETCIQVENLIIKTNLDNKLCLNKHCVVCGKRIFSFVGGHHSEETKRRMSEKRRGEKHHMYGKHHSEETKKKIGDSERGDKNCNYGKPRDEETRIKISKAISGEKNGMYGKHHTEEARKSMSEKRKGDKNPIYGTKRSEITCLKISQSNKGRLAPNRKRVLCVETGKIYNSLKEAAKDVGLKNYMPISDMLRGIQHIAAGCHWKCV